MMGQPLISREGLGAGWAGGVAARRRMRGNAERAPAAGACLPARRSFRRCLALQQPGRLCVCTGGRSAQRRRPSPCASNGGGACCCAARSRAPRRASSSGWRCLLLRRQVTRSRAQACQLLHRLIHLRQAGWVGGVGRGGVTGVGGVGTGEGVCIFMRAGLGRVEMAGGQGGRTCVCASTAQALLAHDDLCRGGSARTA